jgi:hypothetical protein
MLNEIPSFLIKLFQDECGDNFNALDLQGLRLSG